jgi:hypothetical protein
MYMPDVSGAEQVIQVAGSPEGVKAALLAWLADLQASSEPAEDDPVVAP